MNRIAFKSLTAVVVVILALLAVSAQRRPTVANVQVNYLPESDAIARVDVHRLMTETMPRVFAGDLTKLAQLNADLEKFKTRTGIDPRSFQRVVIGMRYTHPTPKITKVEAVAIAQGTFDAKALAESARAVTNYREEKYRGKTIAVFTVNEQMKLLGLWDVKVSELAASLLDPNTLAIGSLPNVKAAIDTGKTTLRGNVALANLAYRDPSAVIGFGSNVPAELFDSLDLDNEAVMKDIKSIKQVYGSMGTTDTDVSVSLVARTDGPEAAKSLSETVIGLKQLGSLVVMRMAAPKKDLVQNALDNLKITARGNELEISTRVAASGLASLVK